MNFNIDSYSDIGKRNENQDSLGYKLLNNDILVSCIADGVGGKKGGKIASQLCVYEFIKELENNINTENILKKTLLKIHKSILKTSKESINLGMASTFTGVLIDNYKLKGIHTGDTRICILRGNGIKQITKDQTEVARLVREGLISFEEAQKYPRRNIIESALGVIDREPNLFEFEFDLEVNDRIILTTDGVHENLSKKELRDISLKSKTSSDFISNIKEILILKEPNDNNSILTITIN
jgi:serine/threonine protein phosphatase PrpC